MANSTIQGLDQGVNLISVRRSVTIANSSMGHSDTGLHIYEVSGNITLTGNTFEGGEIGIDAYRIRRFDLSDSVFTRHSDKAIGIRSSRAEDITLNNNVILNNRIGIDLDRLELDGGDVLINVTDGIQHNNVLHFRLDLDEFDSSDSVRVNLERNSLVGGKEAVIFVGRKAGAPVVWNIADNEFLNVTGGQVMRLRGTGNVTANTIRHCSYPGGDMVDVIAESNYSCALIDGNTFEENKNVSSVMSFCSSCDNGRILENAFFNNQIINSVITCVHTGISATTEHLLDNVIVNNSVSIGPKAFSAALTIRLGAAVEAHGNSFVNPNLTYEVVSQLPTLNSSIRLDFSNNSWGNLEEDDKDDRILDGSDSGWCPPVDRLPKTDVEQSFQTTGRLHGRLDKSLTLSRQTDPYTVSGELVVPAGVTLTLEAGVTLTLERTAGLFIEGQLVARGSPDSPVLFQRTDSLTPVMPLRLVNGHHEYEGRLEALLDGTWRPICEDGWSTYNAHVACRQLGFDKGIFSATSAVLQRHVIYHITGVAHILM